MSGKKLPIKYGLDWVRDKNWNRIVRDFDGAQKLANELAEREKPKGFWHGVVSDEEVYFRISIAGQPEKK